MREVGTKGRFHRRHELSMLCKYLKVAAKTSDAEDTAMLPPIEIVLVGGENNLQKSPGSCLFFRPLQSRWLKRLKLKEVISPESMNRFLPFVDKVTLALTTRSVVTSETDIFVNVDTPMAAGFESYDSIQCSRPTSF